jgi:SAM-dependent methyltransferase
MRVLEIGSGMGDVSLLAAQIVGPAGHVLGIDRNATAVAAAAQRAVDHGCSSWVSFETSDLDRFETADSFDALVGRYILICLPDPAATIRNLLRFVRPAIVVFHDVDFTHPHPSYPPGLYDQVFALLGEVFRRAGRHPDFGRRLGNTFLSAGLPFPTVVSETIVGGGAGSDVYSWIASTIVSLAAQLEKFGLTLPPEFAADGTLAARLEQEAVGLGAQLLSPVQFGAWARRS